MLNKKKIFEKLGLVLFDELLEVRDKEIHSNLNFAGNRFTINEKQGWLECAIFLGEVIAGNEDWVESPEVIALMQTAYSDLSSAIEYHISQSNDSELVFKYIKSLDDLRAIIRYWLEYNKLTIPTGKVKNGSELKHC